MSGTSERRRVGWHETCKCKSRFNSSFCNKKQLWNDDKCWCECKELIGKGVCDKGFVWNLSSCECECYKSCCFSEFLDYKNCDSKKRLVHKLAEECTENSEEIRVVEITSAKNENKHKCSSYMLHIVLFSIFFTINVGIVSYLNGKRQTNRDQKSNLLFLQWHNQPQKFQINPVRNPQKILQRHWYSLYWTH